MRLVIGITGASGALLAKRMIECAAAYTLPYVTATKHGEEVFRYETGMELERFLGGLGVAYYGARDMFAPIASGSFDVDAMVVVPCSMSAAGKLANCCGDSLLIRAADVTLKEKRKLIIVPRETPMHTGHLRNLLTLSEMGAVIMPPVPAFYNGPQTLDEVAEGLAGRTLRLLGIENGLYKQWKGIENEKVT